MQTTDVWSAPYTSSSLFFTSFLCLCDKPFWQYHFPIWSVEPCPGLCMWAVMDWRMWHLHCLWLHNIHWITKLAFHTLIQFLLPMEECIERMIVQVLTDDHISCVEILSACWIASSMLTTGSLIIGTTRTVFKCVRRLPWIYRRLYRFIGRHTLYILLDLICRLVLYDSFLLYICHLGRCEGISLLFFSYPAVKNFRWGLKNVRYRAWMMYKPRDTIFDNRSRYEKSA